MLTLTGFLIVAASLPAALLTLRRSIAAARTRKQPLSDHPLAFIDERRF